GSKTHFRIAGTVRRPNFLSRAINVFRVRVLPRPVLAEEVDPLWETRQHRHWWDQYHRCLPCFLPGSTFAICAIISDLVLRIDDSPRKYPRGRPATYRNAVHDAGALRRGTPSRPVARSDWVRIQTEWI